MHELRKLGLLVQNWQFYQENRHIFPRRIIIWVWGSNNYSLRILEASPGRSPNQPRYTHTTPASRYWWQRWKRQRRRRRGNYDRMKTKFIMELKICRNRNPWGIQHIVVRVNQGWCAQFHPQNSGRDAQPSHKEMPLIKQHRKGITVKRYGVSVNSG